jgi:hypothetical protein
VTASPDDAGPRTPLEEALRQAAFFIEVGENRAMATDGPVPHFRGELDDREWRQLWLALAKIRDLIGTLADGREQAATEARRELLAKVDKLANDVRYGGSAADTSWYWRGFNDGIDKLVLRLIEAPSEKGARG